MIARPFSLTGLAAAAGVIAGCNLVVGSVFDVTLRSPSTDAAADAPPPTLDPRCQVIGDGAGSPIRIGAILPMTLPDGGPANDEGVYRKEAILLVFNQLSPPVRPGINGRPLQLILCDNSGDSTQSAGLATSLIQQGVPAIIGATSSDVLAEVTVTLPNRVLLISSSATADEISSLSANDPKTGVRMVWRTAPPDSYQGEVMARVLARGIPDAGIAPAAGDAGTPANLGVFEVNNPYGQGLVGTLQTDYAAYGGNATNAGLYTENGDVSQALMDVATTPPAPRVLVAVAFPPDAVKLANGVSAYASLTGIPFFFSDSAKSPGLFTGLTNPNQLEGALGTAPATAASSSPAFLWFNTEFEATYAQNPQEVSFIPNTFDAAMLVAIGAAWASLPGHTLDGPTMAEALTRVSADGGPSITLDPVYFDTAIADLAMGGGIDIQGASGSLDFNPKTGEAPAAIEVWQVADGGFTTRAVVEP